MTDTPLPARFTVEDLIVLKDVIKTYMDKHPGNSFLTRVYASLEVLIKRNAPGEARRLVCIDDCANFTGPGYNGLLFDAQLNTLPNMRIRAGYLGKAIVDWRLCINK